MTSARLANPLFGAIARSERGRQLLTAEGLQPWVRPWLAAPDPRAWWIDRAAGLALLQPQAVLEGAPGESAVLAVRGAVFGTPGQPPPGRPDPPPGWPGDRGETGTAALLYDLLDRDTAAIDALRGQFALAVWDGRRRRLLLARDHLGQRSLFWRTGPDLLLFCSELAPLLRAEGGCGLDAEAAVWYLAFGMPPPGRTLGRGIERLPAAHVLSWEPGRPPLIQRYWSPLHGDAPRDATPEVVERLRTALDESLSRRLTGPTGQTRGLFLSGGIDSTYLAAAAAVQGVRLTGFTSAFEDEHGMNETDWAGFVAGTFGLPHRIVPLHAAEAGQLLEEVVLAAAEPCAAWAALTHFRVLAAARQEGALRVLSGLGSDEIFGGYDHFRGYQARFLRHARRSPAPPGSDPFEALLLPEEGSSRRVLYPGVARFFDDPSLRRGLGAPYRSWQYASHLRTFYRECRRIKPDAEFMEMMIAHECQHRIPDLLFANFEPLSRRLGVEVTYPFLDPDLVTLATGLAVESRYRTASGRFSLRLRDLHPRYKHAMLLIAAGRVPEPVRERPRKSFTAPFGAWLYDPRFGPAVLSRLRRSRFWDRGIVERRWLDHVVERLAPGPNPWVSQLWALVTLAGWYDRFVEPPSETP
jgi:asparagine synthase (glutamine-hydrolysing)